MELAMLSKGSLQYPIVLRMSAIERELALEAIQTVSKLLMPGD